jgi:hypothetical protein
VLLIAVGPYRQQFVEFLHDCVRNGLPTPEDGGIAILVRIGCVMAIAVENDLAVE